MDVTDSILNSVKKLLGYEPEYKEFDPDILININAAISSLRQMGIGPKCGFVVMSEDDTYEDYLGFQFLEVPQVKLYLFYKTKLGFDTPQSSYLVEQYRKEIQEIEWRLTQQADSGDLFGDRKYDE